MKTCALCGRQSEDNEPDCLYCGSSIFLNKCPNCGTEFEEEFCPTCGYVVEVAPRDSGKEFVSPEKKSLFGKSKADIYADRSVSFSFLGITTCVFIPLSVIGVVFAVVFAILALKRGCSSNKPLIAITIAVISLIVDILIYELYKPMILFSV